MFAAGLIGRSQDRLRQAAGRTALGNLFPSSADCAASAVVGQSNGNNVGRPILNTAPLRFAYCFDGGPRPRDAGTESLAVVEASIASLRQYVEQNNPDNAEGGASPIGPAWDMIRQMFLGHYGGLRLDLEPQRMVLFGACSGTTAAQRAVTGPIDESIYSFGLECVAAAETAAALLGFEAYAGMQDILSIDGEDDDGNGTDPTSYQTSTETIRAGFESASNTASGATRDLVMYRAQVGTHPRWGLTTPGIALQQLAAETADGDYGRVVPTYMLPLRDNLHYTNQGGTILAAMLGLQIWFRRVLGMDGWGIRAGSATTDGSTVTIPIVWLDGSPPTEIVADTTGGTVTRYGFDLVNSGGSAVTITSNSIVNNAGTWEIRLGYSSGTPARWRYGWRGPTGGGVQAAGQIRGTGIHRYRDSLGAVTRLDPWLPICDGAIAA